MTKVICSRYFPSRWRTGPLSFLKSSSARGRRVLARAISKPSLRRWKKSRTRGAISKRRNDMPYYQKLGQIPKKHHIWFHRNGAAPTYKNEGIPYEHVFTTQGFDQAYSIIYHPPPPTRFSDIKLIKCEALNIVTDEPLHYHQL